MNESIVDGVWVQTVGVDYVQTEEIWDVDVDDIEYNRDIRRFWWSLEVDLDCST